MAMASTSSSILLFSNYYFCRCHSVCVPFAHWCFLCSVCASSFLQSHNYFCTDTVGSWQYSSHETDMPLVVRSFARSHARSFVRSFTLLSVCAATAAVAVATWTNTLPSVCIYCICKRVFILLAFIENFTCSMFNVVRCEQNVQNLSFIVVRRYFNSDSCFSVCCCVNQTFMKTMCRARNVSTFIDSGAGTHTATVPNKNSSSTPIKYEFSGL